MFVRDFQPLSMPQPLDALVIDVPAGVTKQISHALIAVAAISGGQFDHVGNQALLILTASGYMALSGAVLTKNLAGPAFGDTERATNLVNAPPPARGA